MRNSQQYTATISAKVQQIMKERGLKPAFSPDQYLEFQRKEQAAAAEVVMAKQRQQRIENLLKRDGIRPLHQQCTLGNFEVKLPAQQQAVYSCNAYLQDFHRRDGVRHMVFCGETGTGKNHLASAVCKEIIARGLSAAVISVAEYQAKLRATMNKNAKQTEEQILEEFTQLDLLVLDEVDLGSKSAFAEGALNLLLDKRITNLGRTILISNLNTAELHDVLQARIYDRIFQSCFVVNFNWPSHRTGINHSAGRGQNVPV